MHFKGKGRTIGLLTDGSVEGLMARPRRGVSRMP